jgi:hypothetical protein
LLDTRHPVRRGPHSWAREPRVGEKKSLDIAIWGVRRKVL